MKIAPRLMARRLRQHHGIEHATVTLLSRRLPGIFIAARSDLQGFIVYGDVDTLTLRAAVEEALGRLQQGERQLAVHPNCGTNLVVAGLIERQRGVVAQQRAQTAVVGSAARRHSGRDTRLARGSADRSLGAGKHHDQSRCRRFARG